MPGTPGTDWKYWLGVAVSGGLLVAAIAVFVAHRPAELGPIDVAAATAAFILLLLGICGQYLVWHTCVRGIVGDVRWRHTFCAFALTLWGKYLPGKVWSLLGRASVLARYSGLPVVRLVAASSIAQICMVTTGVLVGLPVLETSGLISPVTTALIAAALIVTAGVAFVLAVASGYLGIPGGMGPVQLVRIWSRPVILGLATWGLLGLGFHYLLRAFGSGIGTGVDVATFAAGTTVGIVTVFAPGGLGVREGALSTILNAHGLELGMAVLAALVARVWFILGEATMFLAGWEVLRALRRAR